MEVIQVKRLTRDYGKGRGVFDLSFAVQQGEVFGFLGPNGAGKTTTIRHLMGFLQPKQGRCVIGGLDCWKKSAGIQKNLGYIPGEMAFPDGMTGNGFLQFYGKYRGMRGEGRKKELMERFDLDARGKIKKMSKGMKQKVGIVAAFMHDPAVLVLDEPTSGLDPLMQNRFIELVQAEKQRGKTILMSSHMFEEVERTCHRVGIIREGRMAAIDSVDTLKAAQVKRYTITLENEEAARAFAGEALQIESVEEARVTVRVQNNIQQLVAVMNRYPIVNIAAPSQNLEDIFLQYYGGEDA
ncbi:ABC transporter ATP-binding protein [Ruminococcaceae bacterium OttesenSCG-928-A11]|nr:ABC transporter ATP-binding protein [Ruminococcaceae bacterium OttesenSCG-928-A11]